MGASREIRQKIGTIKSTQKITRAMQMVAASKMRKAQDRMNAARPYARKILDVIAHLANAHPEYRHPFMEARDISRAGYIVISTDRGLCGALNVNVMRDVVKELKDWEQKKVQTGLCLVGSKADLFFRRYHLNVMAKATHIGDEVSIKDLIGAVKVMTDAYRKREIDVLFIASNTFVNTMVQRPVIQQLLPIASTATEFKARVWDYIYEPNAKDLLQGILTRYLEAQVYAAVIENYACEQASRMLSMKNATDNAGHVIDNLRLIYNKARQAVITNEIAEIVGGAQAINQ